MNYSNITPITELWKEWTFLNPNFNVQVEFEGMAFPTLRHALEATKTQNQEERERLIEEHPFWVANWGAIRPFEDDPNKDDWRREISDVTLILTAAKFGLVDATTDKGKTDDKLRMKLAFWLTLTQGRAIRYENTHCDTLWGVCFCKKHRRPIPMGPTGDNELGRAMMTIRSRLIRKSKIRSFLTGTCDWCYNTRNQRITPAVQYIIYFREEVLNVHSFCRKHEIAEKHDARKFADGKWFIYDMRELPPEVSLEGIMEPSRIIVPRERGWRAPRAIRQAAQQIGFHMPANGSGSSSNWSGRRSSWESCSNDRDYKDRWGSLIITADGVERNHVIAAV